MKALMQPRSDIHSAFAQRMTALAGEMPLSSDDRRLLSQIDQRSRRAWRAHVRLVQEGQVAPTPLLIVSGWACQQRELADGRRQVVQLLGPGDVVGLLPRRRAPAPASVTSLVSMKTVDAPELRALMLDGARHPALAAALDAAEAEYAALLVQSIVRVGRQTAYERLAHLLLELDWRLSQRGLSTDGAFAFPLTQEMIADTLGLSVVHVNRTLQQMRREGVIEFAHGGVRLPGKAALRAVAEFRAPDGSADAKTETP